MNYEKESFISYVVRRHIIICWHSVWILSKTRYIQRCLHQWQCGKSQEGNGEEGKYFRQYNWLENTISTTDELPPDFIVTAVDILFSSKSQTVSAMFFYMTDENRDSVYNQLYKELVSTYHHHHSYTDGTTFFIVKNKKNKDVGLVLLKKQHENDVAVVVVDYKNHFKAIKEGGKYLEEFYLNLNTLSH